MFADHSLLFRLLLRLLSWPVFNWPAKNRSASGVGSLQPLYASSMADGLHYNCSAHCIRIPTSIDTIVIILGAI